ncbi:MAG: efflux RND transporter periplasmic adaptor subunit [Oscillospiraceae bacterium]|nr:efflux RND transporter periplasmic adaptor subunit [Oscillospiraceae bacterium]
MNKVLKKKLIVLSIIFVIITVIIYFIPAIIKNSIILVNITYPKLTKYRQFMNCDGEIKEENCKEIYLDVPVIIGRLYVQDGDFVETGQKLADIDKSSTINALSKINPSDAISVFLSSEDISLNKISQFIDRKEFLEENISKYLRSDVIPSAIYAPCPGKISFITREIGLVSPFSAIASISQNNKKIAFITVNEENISKIELGQIVYLTSIAFPKQQFSGEIYDIAPRARKIIKGTNIQTVIDAYVKLDDGQDILKNGYTVTAKVMLGEGRPMIIVPYENILQDNENKEFVYLYKNGRAMKQAVVTGAELTNGVEIVQGLSMGDMIIDNPENIYSDRQFVRLS